MGLIISGIIGFASALLFAYILYWLDRFEKEPLLLLAGLPVGRGGGCRQRLSHQYAIGLGIYEFTGSISPLTWQPAPW